MQKGSFVRYVGIELTHKLLLNVLSVLPKIRELSLDMLLVSIPSWIEREGFYPYH